MIVYSFIIPHKNCPVLLNRCLDSIPTRDDIQIIVVDDNSDVDKKPTLSRQDVELVLLDEEHSKGAGRARNVGMEKAQGKWLLFADADDYYTDYLPKLLDKYADDNQTDIVYLNAHRIDDQGKKKPLIINRLINNYLKGIKGAEANLRYGVWTPWTRMVKRELVFNHHLSFEELPAGNDRMFGLKASMYSKTIGVEKEFVYKYYKWPNGSVTDKIRQNLVDELLTGYGRVMVFYKTVGYQNKFALLNIIENLVREKKITVKQAFVKYKRYLKEYNLFWGKDITCYLYNLIFVRVRKRAMLLFREWFVDKHNGL